MAEPAQQRRQARFSKAEPQAAVQKNWQVRDHAANLEKQLLRALHTVEESAKARCAHSVKLCSGDKLPQGDETVVKLRLWKAEAGGERFVAPVCLFVNIDVVSAEI